MTRLHVVREPERLVVVLDNADGRLDAADLAALPGQEAGVTVDYDWQRAAGRVVVEDVFGTPDRPLLRVRGQAPTLAVLRFTTPWGQRGDVPLVGVGYERRPDGLRLREVTAVTDRREDHASRETIRRAAKALRRGTVPRAVLGGIRAHVERELIVARARAEGVDL